MITAVKLFTPDGKEFKDLVVGSDGISKIFFDYNKETRTTSETLIVLAEDNILEFHGFLCVVQKDYKTKE